MGEVEDVEEWEVVTSLLLVGLERGIVGWVGRREDVTSHDGRWVGVEETEECKRRTELNGSASGGYEDEASFSNSMYPQYLHSIIESSVALLASLGRKENERTY